MKIKQTSLFLITNILGITNYITLRFQLLNIFNIDSDNNIDNFSSVLFVPIFIKLLNFISIILFIILLVLQLKIKKNSKVTLRYKLNFNTNLKLLNILGYLFSILHLLLLIFIIMKNQPLICIFWGVIHFTFFESYITYIINALNNIESFH